MLDKPRVTDTLLEDYRGSWPDSQYKEALARRCASAPKWRADVSNFALVTELAGRELRANRLAYRH
jgi:hypothetical protein